MSNAKCRNSFFMVFLAHCFFFFFFPLRSQFFSFFSPWQLKKSHKLGSVHRAIWQKVSPYTYARGFVRQTFFFLAITNIRFGGTRNSETSLNSHTRIWIQGRGSVNSDTLSLFWISALTETIRHTTRYVQELSLMFAKDLSVQIKFLSVQIL